ncbi:MAG: pyridoxamine 5'-phosphate oxidase family protein [Microthrixaceae bacterium]
MAETPPPTPPPTSPTTAASTDSTPPTPEVGSKVISPTPATTIRNAKRARLDREEAYAILDDDVVAHVGFVLDAQPFVIPMVYGRRGDSLFLHGSVATRIMRALDAGVSACVTVTKLDGLVLARSHFHHSVNYRCVVALGTARRLRDDAAMDAFDVIMEHLMPGRVEEARRANRPEQRQTMVIEFPLVELSVKVRDGGPVDDEVDLPDPDELSDLWAGVVPLRVVAGTPIADEFTSPNAPLPSAVATGATRWPAG